MAHSDFDATHAPPPHDDLAPRDDLAHHDDLAQHNGLAQHGDSAPVALRGRNAKRRRPIRACGVALSVVALFVVIAASALFIRLSFGPISVDALAPFLQRALRARVGKAYAVTLGGSTVEIGSSGLALSVDGLSLSSLTGQPILAAPKAEVAVDPLALMVGNVRPTSLEVYDVALRLVVLPDGSAAISAGAEPIVLNRLFGSADAADAAVQPEAGPSQPGASAPMVTPPENQARGEPAPGVTASPITATPVTRLGSALRTVLNLIARQGGPLGALQRVGVSQGRLIFEDRASGQTTVFEGFDLAFAKSRNGTQITVSAEGPNGRWKLSALEKGAPGSARSLDVAADGISLDDLTLAAGVREAGFDLDSQISAHAQITLTPSGAYSSATGSASIGSGFFRLHDPDAEPMRINHVATSFSWDGKQRRFNIDPVDVSVSDGTHFQFAGSLTPPAAGAEMWSANLHTQGPAVFGPDLPHEQPIRVDSVTADARISVEQRKVFLDHAQLSGPDLQLALQGVFGGVDPAAPKIILNGKLGRSRLRRAVRVWPNFIAAPVRGWLLDHVQSGFVDSGSMALSLTTQDLARMKVHHSPEDADVNIDFAVSNGSVTFLEGIPPLAGLAGSGHVTGHTVTFNANQGAFQGAAGRQLSLVGASFNVPDTDPKPSPATVVSHLSGTLDSFADILGRDGLKPYGGGVPIDTKLLSGQVDAQLTINTRLGRLAKAADTSVQAAAKVTNFSIDHMMGKQRLEQATLDVTVDPSGLQATGQGQLMGTPATISLQRPRGPGSSTQTLLAVNLDDAMRAKIGFGVPGLTGLVGARFSSVLGQQSDHATAQVELDLTRATFEGTIPGYVKPAGKAAKASFQIATDSGGVGINNFAYDAGPSSARGTLRFDTTGALEQAHLTQLRLSPGDDMRADAEESKEGLKVTLRGAVVDGRPFFHAMSDNHASDNNADAGARRDTQGKDLTLDVRAGLLTGANHEAISNFILRFAKHAGVIRQFQLAGRIGHGSVAGVLVRSPKADVSPSDAPQINITSSDAGELVAFTDLYKRLDGGVMSLTMALDDASMAGRLSIRNFVVKDEPNLRRIVNESVRMEDHGKVRIDANSAPFTKLQVDFARSAGRIELRNGAMYGPQIGTTIEGWLDFTHNQVNLDGTFVPAYGVNNLFSQIPVFGLLLGGGAHEGLFGVNFRITGSANAPVLTINPLSAIAPGFLRKVFGALDNAANGQSLPPQAQSQGQGLGQTPPQFPFLQQSE